MNRPGRFHISCPARQRPPAAPKVPLPGARPCCSWERACGAENAACGGASLPVIGALLGHGNATTTARYAHLSNDPLRAVNERIGSRLATALDKKDGDKAAS